MDKEILRYSIFIVNNFHHLLYQRLPQEFVAKSLLFPEFLFQ